MLINKKLNHEKLDKNWGSIIKQGTSVLNDKTKSDKVDKYAKGGEEIKTLQDALNEKETNLKKKENSLLEEKQAIDDEKTHFAIGGKKAGWKATHDAFRQTWRTNGWDNLIKAHYPDTYLDNLYTVDGKKLTEDQITKILVRVIYEVGRIDRDEFVANHGITDATDKANIENTFDEIVRISGEIEELNKVGDSQVEVEITNDDGSKKKVSAWKDRTKTWDLPMTYSEPQKVHSNSTRPNNNNPLVLGKNNGDNEKAITERSVGWNLEIEEIDNFIKRILTDEFIGKLTKLDDITKTETNFDIYQAGDAYSDEQLKEYGIEVANNNITTLYRSNLKYDETTKKWVKTDKLPINIQNGLKDWAKLFKSAFPNKEAIEKLEKSLKGLREDTDPNGLLLNDLRSQTGTENPFTHGGNNYRLYEDLKGVQEAEKELFLRQDEKIKGVRELRTEVDSEKRIITNKTAENKKTALEVSKIADEILTKKKEALKVYKLEDGFDGDHKRDWITLRKIYKLILEIRYLENNGDATRKCVFENDATNHCQTLIGTYDATTNTTVDEDLDTRLNIEGTISEFYLVRYLKMLNHETGVDKVIDKIKNGEDDLLAGMDNKEKFELYWKHLDGVKKVTSLTPEELAFYKAIGKELGKDDNQETILDWRNALGDIDNTVITETWKAKWTALTNFKEVAKVKAFLDKPKDKDDFLAQAKALESKWTSWTEIAKEEPDKVIGLITYYEYEKLDDNSTNEKDKKKTQMKRRIAKALNKTKDSEISDTEIKDNLIKIEKGELTVNMSKFYTADLKEITNSKEETPSKPFLENPLTYIIGLSLFALIGVVIWKWDAISNWFNPKEVDEEQEDEDDADI